MRSAKFMSPEMIDQLFEEFRKDQRRWAEFEKLELAADTYSEDNIEPSPGRAEIVHRFVDERLGADNGYEVAGLILRFEKQSVASMASLARRLDEPFSLGRG